MHSEFLKVKQFKLKAFHTRHTQLRFVRYTAGARMMMTGIDIFYNTYGLCTVKLERSL